MPNRPFPPPIVARLATFLVSLVLALAATEWATRRWIETPATAVLSLRFGVVHRPHVRLVFSTEGWSEQVTNAYGFVDQEVRAQRPRIRALLLGDSFSEGLETAQRLRLDQVAERADPGLEVINTGGPRKFMAHYAAFLPEFQKEFSPDVVVVQVDDGDVPDLADPQMLVEVREQVAGRSKFPLADAPPPRMWLGRLRELLRQSGMLRRVYAHLDLLSIQERARFLRKFGLIPPEPADAQRSIPERARIEADSLLDAIIAVNPRVVLLYVPHLGYFARPPVHAEPASRAFWHALAERHDVLLVDPTDAMLADYERTGQPLHGFSNSTIGAGHINARGHAVIGRLMAQAIETVAR